MRGLRAGFDCSGLIMYCAKSAHIPYSYLTTGMMTSSNSMRRLAVGEKMQPGDVMLFSGHVGFYDPGHAGGDVLSAMTHGLGYGDPKYFGGHFIPLRMRVKC